MRNRLIAVILLTLLPLSTWAECRFEQTQFSSPDYPNIKQLSIIHCEAPVYHNPCTLFANKTNHQVLLMGKSFTRGTGLYATEPIELWSSVGLLDFDINNPIVFPPHGSRQIRLRGVFKCSVRFPRTGQVMQEQCDNVLRFKTEVTKNTNGNC